MLIMLITLLLNIYHLALHTNKKNVIDDPLPIDDSFLDEQLASINVSHSTPWYADYANYIVAKYLPPRFTYQEKKKYFMI